MPILPTVMLKRFLTATLIFLGWMALFPGSPAVGVPARATGETNWRRLETRHTVINYQSHRDLKQFDRRIAYYTEDWGALKAFFRPDSESVNDSIRKKVDGIFERAQQLLGMYKRMDKVQIYICRDKEQLFDNYYRIHQKPGRYRAWYVYSLNAVYVNHKDLDEGMLSHELTHAIVDHYLLVRPPRASAEILASYVDLHLFE